VDNGTLESAAAQGPLRPEATPDSLILRPEEDEFREYELTLTASNDHGTTETAVSGTIQGLADVTGQVVEATTREEIQGEYQVRDDGTVVAEETTDRQGNFSFQLPPGTETGKLRFDKDNFFGRVTDFQYEASDPDTSGVKEAMFSMQPAKDVGLSPEETKDFLLQTLYGGRQGNGTGYRAWYETPKLIALKQNPLSPETDSFSANEMDNIESVRQALEACTNREYQLQINQPGDTSGVTLDEDRDIIMGEQGNIAIYKNQSAPLLIGVALNEEGETPPGKFDNGRVVVNRELNGLIVPGTKQDLYKAAMVTGEAEEEFSDVGIIAENSRFTNYQPGDCQMLPYYHGEGNGPVQESLNKPMTELGDAFRLEQ